MSEESANKKEESFFDKSLAEIAGDAKNGLVNTALTVASGAAKAGKFAYDFVGMDWNDDGKTSALEFASGAALFAVPGGAVARFGVKGAAIAAGGLARAGVGLAAEGATVAGRAAMAPVVGAAKASVDVAKATANAAVFAAKTGAVAAKSPLGKTAGVGTALYVLGDKPHDESPDIAAQDPDPQSKESASANVESPAESKPKPQNSAATQASSQESAPSAPAKSDDVRQTADKAAAPDVEQRARDILRKYGYPTSANEHPESAEYVVKKGDTLYGIAALSGIDYKQLAAENGIKDPNIIQIGAKLRLPSGVSHASDMADISPPPSTPANGKTAANGQSPV